MDHAPYFREGTGKDAVLLIHGIAGSPAHFRDLVPVIPEAYSIYNILLDGHNGTVKDFGRSSMAKWKAQVQAVLTDLLAKHGQIVIVGHSMGTLFAIQAAIDHPDRIAALFLLSVPTRPWVRFSTTLTCLRVAWGRVETPKDRAMRGDTGITLTKRLWEYLGWVPRMTELLLECERIRKQLPQLAVPTQTFQSHIDELVSIRSCKDLEGIPCVQNTVLYDSGHFVYGPEDTRLLQNRLAEVLAHLTSGKMGL